MGFPESFRGTEPYRRRLKMPQGFGTPESEDFGDEEGDYFGPMYAAAFAGGVPEMPGVLEGSFGKEAIRPQAVAAEKSLRRPSLLPPPTMPPAGPEARRPRVTRHRPIPEVKPETAKPIAPNVRRAAIPVRRGHHVKFGTPSWRLPPDTSLGPVGVL